MEFLLIVIGVIAFVLILFQIVSIIQFGFPPKDEDVLEAIKANNYSVQINRLDNGILCIGKMPFIARMEMCILNKYYIHEVGIIPRWYKSHKIINKLFNEHKITKRKKLGLQ